MKYCKKCGAEMNDDHLFCTHCGFTEIPDVVDETNAYVPEPDAVDVNNAPQFQQTAQNSDNVKMMNTPADKKKNKTGLIILLVVIGVIVSVILIIVGSALIMNISGDPSDRNGTSSYSQRESSLSALVLQISQAVSQESSSISSAELSQQSIEELSGKSSTGLTFESSDETSQESSDNTETVDKDKIYNSLVDKLSSVSSMYSESYYFLCLLKNAPEKTLFLVILRQDSTNGNVADFYSVTYSSITHYTSIIVNNARFYLDDDDFLGYYLANGGNYIYAPCYYSADGLITDKDIISGVTDPEDPEAEIPYDPVIVYPTDNVALLRYYIYNEELSGVG